MDKPAPEQPVAGSVIVLSAEEAEEYLNRRVRRTTSFSTIQEWTAAYEAGLVDPDLPSTAPLAVLTGH